MIFNYSPGLFGWAGVAVMVLLTAVRQLLIVMTRIHLSFTVHGILSQKLYKIELQRSGWKSVVRRLYFHYRYPVMQPRFKDPSVMKTHNNIFTETSTAVKPHLANIIFVAYRISPSIYYNNNKSITADRSIRIIIRKFISSQDVLNTCTTNNGVTRI